MELVNPATGEIVENKGLDEIVELWISAKEQLKELAKFKDILEMKILGHVKAPIDSKTAHLSSRHGNLKIQYRETAKWDQNRLHEAAFLMNEKFFDYFKIEYKPKAIPLKKLENTDFSDETLNQAKEIIFSAREIRMGKPYITLEK